MMTTLQFTEQAQKVLTAMREQVQAVNLVWAQNPGNFQTHVADTARGMTLSLVNQLTSLCQWGDGAISRDDELSMTMSTPHIFFGLIFHAKGRPDSPLEDDPVLAKAPRLGRYCFGDKQDGNRGTVRCGEPIYRGERTCDGHDLRIVAAPILGDWSFHS